LNPLKKRSGEAEKKKNEEKGQRDLRQRIKVKKTG